LPIPVPVPVTTRTLTAAVVRAQPVARTRGLWHPIGPAYPGQGLLGRICR
jgi:hypothetical protein